MQVVERWILARLCKQTIGLHTQDLVQHLLNNRPHLELDFRSCRSLLSLAKRFSKQRLEAACQRALALSSPTRRSVVSILEKGLENQPLPEPAADTQLLDHENIRGPAYYH